MLPVVNCRHLIHTVDQHCSKHGAFAHSMLVEDCAATFVIYRELVLGVQACKDNR
jgi:hypothetical protein